MGGVAPAPSETIRVATRGRRLSPSVCSIVSLPSVDQPGGEGHLWPCAVSTFVMTSMTTGLLTWPRCAPSVVWRVMILYARYTDVFHEASATEDG